MTRLLLPALLLTLFSCQGPPAEGLRLTPAGSGPTIRFDLSAKPLPEIPIPNDLATRYDPDSPTGRRINVSAQASTEAERKLRKKINKLDGFGVFAPIMVSFEAPLDIEDFRDRHALNREFSDDAVLLVNIDRNSEGFGEAVPLDAGQGNYALGMEWPHQYWDFDEHADSPNLLYETHDEDKNGNGKLDPYEDIDFDGVLDKPNTWSGKPYEQITVDNLADVLAGEDRPIDDLITFYEKETDTLVLWPVTALRQRTRYAVVLTNYLVGEGKKPVRSPFKYVNHVRQTAALEPLSEVLSDEKIDMSLDDVAFAWTYTTQTNTKDLEDIRAGIYGHGWLAELERAYPPDLAPKILHAEDGDGNLPDQPFVLYAGETLDQLFDSAAGIVLGYAPEVVENLKYDSHHTDYWVLGTFTVPHFLVDQDGIATPLYPADDNESWVLDETSGEVYHGPATVTFMCSIPKTTEEHKPPFPVMHYGHGYSGASFEIFGFAGRMAQYGFALCGMDAVGHGLALPADEEIAYDEVIPELLKPLGLTTFYNAFKNGRIKDLDNDGKLSSFDNGGDFWSWDIFHTRDMVRQSVVDGMQFFRIMRALGEIKWEADTNDNGKADDLMGDFNGDGVVDLGTPANPHFPVWGQSMGAIVSQVLAAADGVVPAATPISGGGGLLHVGIRSTNPGVPEAVLMPMMGPFVIFTPIEDEGAVEMAIMINDQHRENRPEQVPRPHYYPFARTTKMAPGDRVIIRNTSNGEEVAAFRHPDGSGFRISIPADAPTAVEKRPLLGLADGDTQPVPVSCSPGSWKVEVNEEGKPEGPATCEEHDLQRSLLFGDTLEVEILDGWDGPSKQVVDTFEMEVTYQGAIFPVGAPLVFINTGLGRARNTPDFRKLLSFSAMIMGPGDPIAYARHFHRNDRLDFSYDPDAVEQTNIIIYHTVGDPNTPIAVSLNLARAAGILPFLPNGDGTSPNDRLLEHHVAEGVEGFWRYTSSFLTVTDWNEAAIPMLKDLRWPWEFDALLEADPDHLIPVHFDADNLDNGIDEFGEPGFDNPVRATLAHDEDTRTMIPFAMPKEGVVKNKGGFMALRLPYTAPLGAHGVEPSHPGKAFNINNFVENQIGVFLASDGTLFSDAPCLANSLCNFLPLSIRETGLKIQEGN